MAVSTPVLLLTHDDDLWERWRVLEGRGWQPARGRTLADLARWPAPGRTLVLLDTDIPGLPGWTDPAWGSYFGAAKVVMADTRPSDERGHQLLSAGASGYVHAYVPIEALDRILQHVQSGEIWMGRSLVARLLRQIGERLPASPDEWARSLTAREQAVARRAAMGEANQAIADALGISERTVRAHLSAVFEKLDVTDRLQLALKVHGIQ